MNKGNKYFLVAKEIGTDQFEIISINHSWGNKLEEIDLYTINYTDSFSLTKHLIEEGKISTLDNDFYIVQQKKEKSTPRIKTQEVLYKKSEEIREVAKSSIEKGLESDKNVDAILGKFCYKMKTNQAFYDMVLFGKTNIYRKFSDYFIKRRFQESNQIKYLDGGWAKKSYPLLRNIVEANARFEEYQKTGKWAPREERDHIIPKLISMTDKNYDRNQLDLFEYFGMKTGDNDGYQKCKRDDGTR